VPAKSSWLLRVPEILQQLEDLGAPVVDRATCQQLFGVKRRRAIDLLQTFGGYTSGNAVLADRTALISRLHEIANTAEYVREVIRKEKLVEKLDDLHRARKAAQIKLPVSAGAAYRTLDDLPSGVVLSPGQLTVKFIAAEELFSKLYALAQLAAKDYDRVCDAAASSRTPTCANQQDAIRS
jgi:hypothetical protein